MAAPSEGFDLIRVKGKLQPVAIWELIGSVGAHTVYGTPEEVRSRVELFERARVLYGERRWKAAQEAFEEILDKWSDDGPSRAYWKRCQEYPFEEPPSAWDGVFTITHK
jgi:adenylate cyclase